MFEIFLVIGKMQFYIISPKVKLCDICLNYPQLKTFVQKNSTVNRISRFRKFVKSAVPTKEIGIEHIILLVIISP